MTPRAQQVAIAKQCGWTYRGEASYGGHCQSGWWNDDGYQPMGPPDYLGDLNMMHQAEKEIWSVQQQWDKYKALLQDMRGDDAIHATALQRAEAFLTALDLWTTE